MGVIVEEKALEPGRFRSLEDAVEIAAGHGVAALKGNELYSQRDEERFQ